MAVSTTIKEVMNRVLATVNLKVDSLTIEKQESERISQLEKRGLLDAALYDDLPKIDESYLVAISETYSQVAEQIDRLVNNENDVDYDHSNTFFSTPDMQALYLTVRHFEPTTIVEIGCGNSSRIARQAIIDGDLSARILAIDPQPRVDVVQHVDELTQQPFEYVDDEAIVTNLGPNDILFIDSSHMVHVGNDVTRAVCRLLPKLKSGVVVHFHDIFLPYEYPKDFASDFPDWGEQYLLYAYLLNSSAKLLWPGYLLQNDREDIKQSLPFLESGRAQSFWFQA